MAKLKTISAKPAENGRRRAEWIARLAHLATQISDWSSAEGWTIERHELAIAEKPLGTYRAPQLTVHLKGGEIIVTPIGLYVAGGNGRVDLEAIPTLARVKLIGADGGWKLYADPNVPLRLKWTRANFIQLAQDLLS